VLVLVLLVLELELELALALELGCTWSDYLDVRGHTVIVYSDVCVCVYVSLHCSPTASPSTSSQPLPLPESHRKELCLVTHRERCRARNPTTRDP